VIQPFPTFPATNVTGLKVLEPEIMAGRQPTMAGSS
jgi:hypothetical protein